MTVRNSSNRILVTDTNDLNTIFDSQNSMPHFLNSGHFTGSIETGQGNHRWSGSKLRFHALDRISYAPLGIFETIGADFIMGKISMVQTSPNYMTTIVPGGKLISLNGSTITEISRAPGTVGEIKLIRSMQLVLHGGEFKLKFHTSSKYFVKDYGSGNASDYLDNTQFNIDIDVYWGKFT